MEQRLDPFYLKSGTANVYDMLIVNANNEMQFIQANAHILAVASSGISAEPPLHPFLLGGL